MDFVYEIHIQSDFITEIATCYLLSHIKNSKKCYLDEVKTIFFIRNLY